MAADKNLKTPGVYIAEQGAPPPSVAGVETSAPVFIGYTQTASSPLQAVEVGSLADYQSAFGGNYEAHYAVVPGTAEAHDFEAADASGAVGFYSVAETLSPRFALFLAIKLFFLNGGGDCYVISVGDYGAGVARQALLDGIAAAENLKGPAMIVVPDACLLTGDGDYAAVALAQIGQASTLRDRMAILDLPGALDPASWTVDGLAAQRDAFYAAIAPADRNSSFGAAYAPALRTSALSGGDVDFTNLQATQAASDLLKSLLVAQATALYGADTGKGQQVLAKLDLAFPADVTRSPVAPADVASLNLYLFNALPLFAQVEYILLAKLDVAAPSGVMAGVWAANDGIRGVWSAPAGMAPFAVVAPEVALSDAQQQGYAAPISGYAIDILRGFAGRGTVVWGARTLDANSEDYRYIQVRRTLIYIEQSIRIALNQFVYAANDAPTWAAITAMVSDFLNGLWKQGALMGVSPRDAYSVQCGLGSTMTAADVLNGILRVQLLVSLIQPAEFIALSFELEMAQS